MADLTLALILPGMWAASVLVPGTRNPRFLACLLVASVVFLLGYLTSGPAGIGLRLGVVLLVIVAFPLADGLGLGSMTRPEQAADRLLERARNRAASGAPRDLRDAVALLGPVIAQPGPLDARWRAELRLQRRAWLMRLGVSPLPASGRTPAESFRIVAVRWLTDLRLRRTIGFRSRIGALEETVALRAYFEDIRTLLPEGPLGPEPVATGSWIGEGRRAIAELESLDLRDPAARDVQANLVALLTLELESHLTGPTQDDATRYAQLSADLNRAWLRVQAPFQDR